MEQQPFSVGPGISVPSTAVRSDDGRQEKRKVGKKKRRMEKEKRRGEKEKRRGKKEKRRMEKYKRRMEKEKRSMGKEKRVQKEQNFQERISIFFLKFLKLKNLSLP